MDPWKQDEQEERKLFTDIKEASSFWKDLWEGNGTGNGSAEWLHDLSAVINDRLPPPEELGDLGSSNK